MGRLALLFSSMPVPMKYNTINESPRFRKKTGASIVGTPEKVRVIF